MNKTGLYGGGVFLAGLVVAVLQFLQPAPATQGHSMVTPDTSRLAQGEPIV